MLTHRGSGECVAKHLQYILYKPGITMTEQINETIVSMKWIAKSIVPLMELTDDEVLFRSESGCIGYYGAILKA